MALGPPTLEQLVDSAQAGDVSAMEELYRRFRPLVRSIARRYRHLPIAEDLEGELYLTFARLVGRFDPGRGIALAHYIERSLALSLHTVVRRECRVLAHHVELQAQVMERTAST